MSEKQESRAERVARYKEERRRQLAAQYGTHEDTPIATRTRSKDTASSSSEGPRPTRASKLRAAALSGQDVAPQGRGLKVSNSE
ncbi:supervillin-like, partial [Anoplophora glabripennis]